MTTNKMLNPVQDALTNPRLALPDGSEIEFRDGQLNYIWTNEAGAQSDRLISWESARQAFTGVPVDSGWLPPEVVRAGLNMGVESDSARTFPPASKIPAPRSSDSRMIEE